MIDSVPQLLVEFSWVHLLFEHHACNPDWLQLGGLSQRIWPEQTLGPVLGDAVQLGSRTPHPLGLVYTSFQLLQLFSVFDQVRLHQQSVLLPLLQNVLVVVDEDVLASEDGLVLSPQRRLVVRPKIMVYFLQLLVIHDIRLPLLTHLVPEVTRVVHGLEAFEVFVVDQRRVIKDVCTCHRVVIVIQKLLALGRSNVLRFVVVERVAVPLERCRVPVGGRSRLNGRAQQHLLRYPVISLL